MRNWPSAVSASARIALPTSAGCEASNGPSGPAKEKLRNSPELKDQRNGTVLYVFGL